MATLIEQYTNIILRFGVGSSQATTLLRANAGNFKFLVQASNIDEMYSVTIAGSGIGPTFAKRNAGALRAIQTFMNQPQSRTGPGPSGSRGGGGGGAPAPEGPGELPPQGD